MILRLVTLVIAILVMTLRANAQDPLKDPLSDLDAPHLGLRVADMMAVVDKRDTRPKTGAMVVHAETTDPSGHLEIADIIIRVHDKLIANTKDFSAAVSQLEIGKKYNVVFFRVAENRGKTTWSKGTVKIMAVTRRYAYLNALKKRSDAVTGTTFYEHVGTTKYVNDRSEFYCYFAINKMEKPQLRFHIQRVAEDWLFIRRIIIKADEQTFTFEDSDLPDVERDHNDMKTWEWLDKPVGKKEREMLIAVANARDVILRCEGLKHQKDRVIYKPELNRIFTVLYACRIMDEE